jgi:hypothetical protein
MMKTAISSIRFYPSAAYFRSDKGGAEQKRTNNPGGLKCGTVHWGKPNPAKIEVYDGTNKMESVA